MGSFLDTKTDGSGQVFMRNRYFDPATGRFTQEDPIGLAGGLNVYGFANGDPVNFSDPFGLCPVPASDCPPGYFAGLGLVSGAAAGAVVATGCTVSTGGVCVLGAPAIVVGFTGLGTSVGALADGIAQNGDAIALEASKLGEKIRRGARRLFETLAVAAQLRGGDPKPPEPLKPDKERDKIESTKTVVPVEEEKTP